MDKLSEGKCRRIENALWGLFAGDALAMPAHWFYGVDTLEETFGGAVRGYVDAPHPHPESFMVGMEYEPDVGKAKQLGRRYDLLHEHSRFYKTTYSELGIDMEGDDGQHGNDAPAMENRFHYHHGMKAGENTTGAQLVRVLLRSVVKEGRYVPGAFLEDFVNFMTTPGRKDAYTEIYLRKWFEAYSKGEKPEHCAEDQRQVWSIGSMGGMARPLVLSMLGKSDYLGLGFAIEHQWLTHRSTNVSAALGLTVPLLAKLLDGGDAREAVEECSAGLRLPRITGEELQKIYRDHKGPSNIPDQEMWELHTRLSEEGMNPVAWAEKFDDADVVQKKLGTVCYPEHGVPLLLFLAVKHGFDVEGALLANTNAGGDNVHRGAILGLLLGAAEKNDFPEHLKNGLADQGELAEEIGAFAQLAVKGEGW